jgi:excisionase family DNA binding protein
MEKLLSTTEAAERLGVTVPRVQSFIWEGRLPAFKVGRAYAIKESDLALVADRKPGRPPMTGEEKTARAKKRAKNTTASKPAKKTAKKKATKKSEAE